MLKHKSSSPVPRLLIVLSALVIVLADSICLAEVASPPKADDNILKQIFAVTEKPQTSDVIEKILKLEQEGQKLSEQGDSTKAIVKFQEAYGLAKEIKYGDGEGRTLAHMAKYYLSRGQISRAKELAENAAEVLVDSRDKKALGITRVTLAQIYLALDNATWAAQQLDLAMKAFTDLSTNDTQGAAKALLLAGDLAIKVGAVKEAMRFYETAASYCGQAGDFSQEVSIEISLAGMLQELGCLSAAYEEATKALFVARNTKRKELIAAALNVVAGCQYSLGEFAAARKSFEEIHKLQIRKQPTLAMAIMDEGYAFTLAATGDTDSAKILLERILPIIQVQGNAFHRAQILNTLGIIESQKGNHAVALNMLRQALELQGIITPKQPRFAVIVMQNLAAASSRAGEKRNAKNQLINAVGAANSKTFKDPLLLVQVYAALGEVCFMLKEFPEAEEYLNKGIEISQSINDDATLWRNYANLARVKLAQSQQQAAIEVLLSAVSFFRSPQAGYFPAPERLTYPSSREELGKELVALLVSVGLSEHGLRTAEQLKEESLIGEWHHRGAEVKPADREMYLDLVTQRAHLHAAEVSSTPNKLLKEWKDWLGRFQQLSKENLVLAHLIAPVPFTREEITKKLQETKATIIDYLIAAHSTIIFTLDQHNRLSATKLTIEADELQNKVSSLLVASCKVDDNARQTERRILQTLYKSLIPEKVQQSLPCNPDETVVIIPDAMLFNLPFAALIDGQGKYLIENQTLTMMPFMSAFLTSPSHNAQDKSLVVTTGNYAPNSGDTMEEASTISRVFEQDQMSVITLGDKGKNAEIDALEEQAKDSTVLHFATNIDLSENNLLKSIIPFSCQENEPDKKVTAKHLFGLTLPNNLAVWSATAVNARDYRGNGVKLFSRGLNYAGVRNILMSLWIEPEPQRIAELVEFYKGKQKGLNQAQSLRRAQLLALSKDPSPYTWAAFQLLGPGN